MTNLVRSSALAFLTIVIILSLLTTAKSQTRGDIVTGVYTDMRRQPETGDIIGVELFIVQTNRGAFIVFQDAEGSPRVPVVVPGKIQNRRIKFHLPERDGYTGKFVGTISGSTISGHFTDGQQSSFGKSEFMLKRRKSFWQ
jgi:hypothetical protein